MVKSKEVKNSNSLETRHVVELVGREDEVPAIITPYIEVNLTGGVVGSGIVNKYGQVNIDDTSLSGDVKVTGIVQGEGEFEDNTLNITTHIEDWQFQPANDNKVLNFFRKRT